MKRNPKYNRKDAERKLDHERQRSIPPDKLRQGSLKGKFSVEVPELRAIFYCRTKKEASELLQRYKTKLVIHAKKGTKGGRAYVEE